MTIEQSDALLATAITEMISSFGRSLLDDPRRVRAGLSDRIGSEARARRAEIDAVVMAVEAGIASRLQSPDFDRGVAMQTLTGRGLTSEVASYSIDVWRHGLGLTTAGSVAPARPSLIVAAAIADDTTDPGVIVEVTEPAVATGEVTGAARAGSAPRRRAMWLAATSVVAVAALVIGLVVFGVFDDDSPVAGAPGGAASLRFDTEQLPWGAALTRTWSARDGGLHGDLTFVNGAKSVASGRHLEVFPKSMAATASLIRSAPSPDEIVQADPILAYDLTIEPGATRTIGYDIRGLDVTPSSLARWRSERSAIVTASEPTTTTAAAVDTTPPVLEIASPASGSILPSADVDIAGTSEAGAAVDFNGTPVAVSADGTWTLHLTIGVGSTTYTVAAIDAAGNRSAPVTYSLTYLGTTAGPSTYTCASGETVTNKSQCPKPTTCSDGSKVSPPSTCPPSPTRTVCANGSTVTPPATCPPAQQPIACWNGTSVVPPDTCPPQPAANRAPAVNTAYANPSHKDLTGSFAYWDIWLLDDAFTDPDGDTWVLYSAGSGQYGAASIVSCSQGGAHKCVRYTPNSANQGLCGYDDQIAVRAWDPNGSTTSSDVLRINVTVACA